MLITNFMIKTSCKFNERGVTYMGPFAISIPTHRGYILIAYKGWRFVASSAHYTINMVYRPANFIVLDGSILRCDGLFAAFSHFNKFIKIPAVVTLNINYICGMRRDVFVEGRSVDTDINFTKLSIYLQSQCI